MYVEIKPTRLLSTDHATGPQAARLPLPHLETAWRVPEGTRNGRAGPRSAPYGRSSDVRGQYLRTSYLVERVSGSKGVF
jgi:hypothetical protein